MMRKLLLTLLLVPALAQAQAQAPFWTEKTMVCDDLKVVLEKLADKFGEVPIWSGVGRGEIDANSNLMVTQNPQTQSWTIVQFNKELACILAIGDGGRHEGLKI